MFPNAYEGIKKIYLAEILGLISVFLGGIAAVIAVIGYQATESGAEDISSASAFVGGGVALIVVGIIAIVAFILNILGISKASADEPNFKKAYSWLFASIIAYIAVGMTKDGSALNLAADLVLYQLADIMVTFYVIDGIISLAGKMGRADLAARGGKLKYMIISVYAISLILTLVSEYMSKGDTVTMISGVLGIIALIISIIAYIMYLRLLSGAKRMLA